VTIVLIAILISFLDDALFKSYKMPSGSMIPRVLIGDYLIVDKLAYGLINPATDELLYTWGAPKRGDLAVFKYPEDPSKIFIKRIVGLPGESVEIRNKDVSINGMHLNEVAYTQYVDPGVIDRKQNPRDNFGPFTIPANNYFMLGDNRDQSLDSRFFGPVDRNAILGKVKIVYWSWKDGRVRWSRIGMILG
jgi:signal peptidase I